MPESGQAALLLWCDMKAEPCQICSNVAILFWRRNARLCEHCCALNPSYSRCGTTAERSPDFLRPMNQPNAMNGSAPDRRSRPCIQCGQPSENRYRWYHSSIYACGWACAGFWMDSVIHAIKTTVDERQEERELFEGEQYVKRSLGVMS